MHQPKLDHPHNFVFAKSRSGRKLDFEHDSVGVKLTRYAGPIFRLELKSHRFDERQSPSLLSLRKEKRPSPYRLEIDRNATLTLKSERGRVLLGGTRNRTFGVCGRAWLLNFAANPDQRFYGMGEKWAAFERSGTKTHFWNRDVLADFHPDAIRKTEVDPIYVSIPYLIVKQDDAYVGILVDNPQRVFMAAHARFGPRSSLAEPLTDSFFVGAPAGEAAVYFIVGPSLAELTEKFQSMVGTTPRPALWTLGHHQSRWGYRGSADLKQLDRKFDEHQIPNDGLWLDIDYMQRFRVFTVDPKHFGSPKRDLEPMRRRGRHVIPILDPGVKVEPGYRVYDEGMREGHFCLTPEGEAFSGFVWPGKSHFPDFSLAEVRRWWSDHVACFAKGSFDGFWIDMNDPSLGSVSSHNMLFRRGTAEHASYHNQYALGMAMATQAGLQRAYPERRPFVITRSASTSISRFAAVWTGDNHSNEAHLAQAIPTALNLALSGVPFNGHDVPGFAGDACDDLMQRWYKAAFLFPFFRNHSCQGTRAQEPWAFSRRTLNIVRKYIRLRYKLLPYIYNLFIDQERTGRAIMRPLLYEFPDSRLALDRIGDQFMLGPSLMHAPVLHAEPNKRRVVLPPGSWYDLSKGGWCAGDRRMLVLDQEETTPLFARAGSIIAMQRGIRKTQHNDLSDIELHVFLKNRRAELVYECDRGEGYGYREGRATRLKFGAGRQQGSLKLDIARLLMGYGPCRLRVISYDEFDDLGVRVDGSSEKRFSMRPTRLRITGGRLPVTISSTWQVS